MDRGASDGEPGGSSRTWRGQPHTRGVLVADVEGAPEEEVEDESHARGRGARRCGACVVGLAHCNGVVTRLAEMNLDEWR